MKRKIKLGWKISLLTVGLLGLTLSTFRPLPGRFDLNGGTVSAQQQQLTTVTQIHGKVVAVTSTNALIVFNPATPSSLFRNIPITGLGMCDSLQDIDFRPLDGRLYGISQTGNLYTVDVQTGAAILVSTTPTMLNGTNFGIDF